MTNNTKRKKGFTLIELMIVVVVIAILASIAIPAYQNFVRQAQRSDGTTALMDIRMAQERFRANDPEYAGDISELVGIGAASPEGRYALAIVQDSESATGFEATATKGGPGTTNPGIADPDCQILTIRYDAGALTRGVVRGGNLVEDECWRR